MRAMTWWDHETNSIWSQPWGMSIAGELEGATGSQPCIWRPRDRRRRPQAGQHQDSGKRPADVEAPRACLAGQRQGHDRRQYRHGDNGPGLKEGDEGDRRGGESEAETGRYWIEGSHHEMASDGVSLWPRRKCAQRPLDRASGDRCPTGKGVARAGLF